MLQVAAQAVIRRGADSPSQDGLVADAKPRPDSSASAATSAVSGLAARGDSGCECVILPAQPTLLPVGKQIRKIYYYYIYNLVFTKVSCIFTCFLLK